MQPKIIGKILPQAIEVEEAVIGALMLEKDAFSHVAATLKPESFYKVEHQKIFAAILDCAERQEPIDLITVTDRLAHRGDLQQVGGAYSIALLTAKVGSAANIDYHASIIANKALARQIISFAAKIESEAFNETTDIAALLQRAEGDLFAICNGRLQSEPAAVNSLMTDALHKIEEAAKQPSGCTGSPSGFSSIDALTAGWQPTDLVIIAARPAMGKTAFALSMARNMAVDYKIPVAFFSLEMSRLQLVYRLLQNQCSIDGNTLKSGRLSNDEWQRLRLQASLFHEAPLYIDETPALPIFELRTKARRLCRQHGIKALFVDYLQLLSAEGLHTSSREQEVAKLSSALKGLAKELNITVFALSQLNRAVETRQGEGKRPGLSDLRESGAIEQDADIVCFIHRPEYYKIFEDEKGNDLHGLADIIIAKHRNGATGDVRLRFEGSFTRFSNIDTI